MSQEIDCGSIDSRIENLEEMEKGIELIANQKKADGEVEHISIFFRDLNSRRWFGINENENFYPGSLAKLPIAMMFYKAAEVNKKILEIPLAITAEDLNSNSNKNYPTQENLIANNSYPLEELIRHILIFSDNAPLRALLDASESFRPSILTDLGIFSYDSQQKEEWNINVKNYANFFRILFNASYIRPEYSQKILDYLARSPFKNALVSGLPPNIVVAHKYGEASFFNENNGKNIHILHDCGIIYKKDSPYILCVMTQGDDFSKLEKVISQISQSIYISP